MIKPEGIPDIEPSEEPGNRLTGPAEQMGSAGNQFYTRFHMLGDYYKAPEREQLLSGADIVRDTAVLFRSYVTGVAQNDSPVLNRLGFPQRGRLGHVSAAATQKGISGVLAEFARRSEWVSRQLKKIKQDAIDFRHEMDHSPSTVSWTWSTYYAGVSNRLIDSVENTLRYYRKVEVDTHNYIQSMGGDRSAQLKYDDDFGVAPPWGTRNFPTPEQDEKWQKRLQLQDPHPDDARKLPLGRDPLLGRDPDRNEAPSATPETNADRDQYEKPEERVKRTGRGGFGGKFPGVR